MGFPSIVIILVILMLLLVPVGIGIGMFFILKNRSGARAQNRDCPGCGNAVAICLNACPHCDSALPS